MTGIPCRPTMGQRRSRARSRIFSFVCGCLMLAGGAPAIAGDVSISKGEGDQVETYVTSDANPAVSFGLFGCTTSSDEYGFELVVLVEEGAQVSPFLARMRDISHSDLQAEICVGSWCHAPEWTVSDYFGAYSGQVSVPKTAAEQSGRLEFRPSSGDPVTATFDMKGTFAEICSQ